MTTEERMTEIDEKAWRMTAENTGTAIKEWNNLLLKNEDTLPLRDYISVMAQRKLYRFLKARNAINPAMVGSALIMHLEADLLGE